MRKLLVGAAECKGAPIHYYLLVETLENGVETYGVLVEYLTQRTEVPGITVFRHRAEALLELLRRDLIEVAIVRTPFPMEGMQCRFLETEPMAAAARPGWFGGEGSRR